eukprot:925982-Rhodomonas_salina.2
MALGEGKGAQYYYWGDSVWYCLLIAMRCAVRTQRMVVLGTTVFSLHTCYAVSGTDLAYGAASYALAIRCAALADEIRAAGNLIDDPEVVHVWCYAMSGTNIAWYCDIVWCYAMSGTDIAHGARSRRACRDQVGYAIGLRMRYAVAGTEIGYRTMP